MTDKTPTEPSWIESIRLRHSMDQEVWDALDELMHRRYEVVEQRSLLRQKDAEIERLAAIVRSVVRGLDVRMDGDHFMVTSAKATDEQADVVRRILEDR